MERSRCRRAPSKLSVRVPPEEAASLRKSAAINSRSALTAAKSHFYRQRTRPDVYVYSSNINNTTACFRTCNFAARRARSRRGGREPFGRVRRVPVARVAFSANNHTTHAPTASYARAPTFPFLVYSFRSISQRAATCRRSPFFPFITYERRTFLPRSW